MAERDVAYEKWLSAVRWRALRLFLVITTSATLLLFGSCYLLEGPPLYYSDPIHIRVVDEETQQPVAGAVALAYWKGQGGFGGSRYLQVAEAVSDRRGWLTLHGWWLLRPPFYLMTFQDPLIRIYKPGGYAGTADNDGAHQFGYQTSDPRRIKRIAFWDGKTVPLGRLKTSLDEAHEIDSLMNVINLRSTGPEIDPIHFPRIWDAIATSYAGLPAKQRETLSDPIGIRRDYHR